MTSDDGLNVYGAATWGQFFIYQGFNAHAGWMHTSSGIDNVDEFAERIELRGKARCYRFATACRPLGVRPVTIRYRTPDGVLRLRNFTTYRTHHGPIVRADRGRWVAFAMMDRPVEALQQSFGRTKARDLAGFLRVAELKANSSNNTIFADDKGEIAYLHPQFVPRRDLRIDFMKAVDGSDPATNWRGLHSLAELPSSLRPASGWVQNTNAWPYRAAGPASPQPAGYPRYMDSFGENFRGLHAQQLLGSGSAWTLEKLNGVAYDSFQPGFAALIPPLVAAFDALPASDSRRARLKAPVALLRGWDFRWGAESVAQSLAIFWGEALMKQLAPSADEPGNVRFLRLARDTSAAQKLAALDEAVAALRRDFGRWQAPWGEINRFQRISPAIAPPFGDSAPSIAVPFPSGNYGSLASFGAGPKPGTKRWYGTSGNSFVAVVEFGPRVRAKAVTAGGASGHPGSPHFNDQASRYASGALRDVYFYPDQLKAHVERTYRPGE